MFNGDVETLSHKINVIEEHCETVGRNPVSVEYSWDGHVLCTRDENKLDDLLELMTSIQFEEEYTDQPDITSVNAHEDFIMGTPEECAERISGLRRLGHHEVHVLARRRPRHRRDRTVRRRGRSAVPVTAAVRLSNPSHHARFLPAFDAVTES